MIQNYLYFDTETTGLPPKNSNYETDFLDFPRIVWFAWSMNGEGKSYIIKPEGYEIPAESTAIHGITTEMARDKGVSIRAVLREFVIDAYYAEKIVAHNIYFDTSVIKSEILRLSHLHFQKLAWDAMDKEKRIDTMRSTMKFVDARNKNGAIKFPSLEELHYKLFGTTFPAHSAKEDVEALIRCHEELVKQNILTL